MNHTMKHEADFFIDQEGVRGSITCVQTKSSDSKVFMSYRYQKALGEKGMEF